ncbi:MAG TPA: response regulator transcription factor [Gemmatimonadaceae bacterium]|nr:response regulator transcription factor [Gemmatimonadaceae bacterium]
MISIVLIEDNRLVREGIAAMLNQTSDFRVVGAVSSGDPALLRGNTPQVILLDLGLWEDDSLRIAEVISKESPQSRIIIMDLLPVHEDIVEFVNAGVWGFIMKDATFEDLVGTIRSVVGGTKVLPPQMTSSLFSQIAREAVDAGRSDAIESVRMTPRERQVIDLIAEGLSNKEIAARLEIAAHTVKSHVRNIMEKLALHSRLQIAAYSNRQGD